MSEQPAPRALMGQPGAGYVHAYARTGWVAYAGGVIELARIEAAEVGQVGATSVVRMAIGPELRRWLATALLADPPAPPLAPLAERDLP